MKVLIADKHDLFREGVRDALQAHEPDSTIETSDVSAMNEALDLLHSGETYDLIVIGACISDKTDLKNIAGLKKRFPAQPVLIMSSDDESACLCSLKQTGVEGLVYKTVEGDELSRSIRQLVDGKSVFPTTSCQHSDEDGAMARAASQDRQRLTSRQKQVLELMAHGKSNRAIAEELDLAEGTVKIHVTAILRALKASNRTQAVIMAADLY